MRADRRNRARTPDRVGSGRNVACLTRRNPPAGSTLPDLPTTPVLPNLAHSFIRSIITGMLYFVYMATKELKKLLDRVPTWPKDAQEELIRSMAEIETRYRNIYHLDNEERVALKQSANDVRNKRFANNEEVDSVFSRFHRA
jgi:hypothetical protein